MDVKLSTSFWAFLRAFGSDWFTRMSGPASVPFAACAVLLPSAPLKALFGCLAGFCVVFSAYRLWRGERLSGMQERSFLENEHERRIDVLVKEASELRRENSQLRVRPYDQAHLRLIEAKLQSLSAAEKDLLRFLLHRGTTDQVVLSRACQDSTHVFKSALDRVDSQGLVVRSEQPRVGRSGIETFWSINPTFEDGLRDLIGPPEEGPPKFSW